MFMMFGILLLGLAAWQVRAVTMTLQTTKATNETVALPHESIGYAVFFAGILLVMGLAVVFGLF
ncbi:hypothetical protein [Lacticaseibacillus sp. N501-2]|uniref:hypothetical protein n=1 Tax=Lacticaseibacillus salsurae TaxID=3367729 RepID=UPI0038B29202